MLVWISMNEGVLIFSCTIYIACSMLTKEVDDGGMTVFQKNKKDKNGKVSVSGWHVSGKRAEVTVSFLELITS